MSQKSNPNLLHQVKQIIPALGHGQHKGQNGRVGVLGGSFEYTGAPYMAALSSLKTGADLSFVFCSKDAAIPIKSYGPELIVIPSLRTSYECAEEKHPRTSKEIVDEVVSWTNRLSALVVGPGLGRDKLMQETTSAIIRAVRETKIPLVIDADGLWAVENDPSLIANYPHAILTPNTNEYQRLCSKVLKKDVTNDNSTDTLKELATRLGNVTIVRKGATDVITDGKQLIECDISGGPRRCGGQGDVLSGTIATFSTWASKCDQKINPLSDEPVIPKMMLAAYGGCTLTRTCARVSFDAKKRSMVAFDLIGVIGETFYDLFEHKNSFL